MSLGGESIFSSLCALVLLVLLCCRHLTDSPKCVGSFDPISDFIAANKERRRRRGFINHWSAPFTQRHFRFPPSQVRERQTPDARLYRDTANAKVRAGGFLCLPGCRRDKAKLHYPLTSTLININTDRVKNINKNAVICLLVSLLS